MTDFFGGDGLLKRREGHPRSGRKSSDRGWVAPGRDGARDRLRAAWTMRLPNRPSRLRRGNQQLKSERSRGTEFAVDNMAGSGPRANQLHGCSLLSPTWVRPAPSCGRQTSNAAIERRASSHPAEKEMRIARIAHVSAVVIVVSARVREKLCNSFLPFVAGARGQPYLICLQNQEMET
jgi:hypothetical protein